MTTAIVTTDTQITFRLPGDVFRAVNPRSFSSPTLVAQKVDEGWAEVIRVTTNIEGIPDQVDVFDSIDADYDDVLEAVEAFNADTLLGWAELISEFFRSERRRNSERRAELDADEAFLLDLEAGFLR